MKHYKLKTGKGELNSTSGNHLCGLVLGNLPKTTLPPNFQARRSDAIADRDILLSQIGLLCNGRNDFNDIDLYREDQVFMNAYGLKAVASESVFREKGVRKGEEKVSEKGEKGVRKRCQKRCQSYYLVVLSSYNSPSKEDSTSEIYRDKLDAFPILKGV